MTEARFRKTFLLLLVIAISVGFLALLQPFLTTILLAAIFSGLAHPIYARMLSGRQRQPPAGRRRSPCC